MDSVILNGKLVKYKYYKKQGLTVVLLHGYLESMDVFTQFADNYLPEIPILIVDIPGHGYSEPIETQQTMGQVATQIVSLFDYLKIKDSIVYGHSMGGYLAQAIVKQIPNRIKLLGLLHSNVYADTDEKKVSRLREIEAIQQGKLSTIAQLFMPKLVAEINYKALENNISQWVENVKTMQPKGIISCIHSMIHRPDNTEMLNGTVPIHLIGGDSDVFLSQQMIDKMSIGTAVREVTMFEKCGHASFIELPLQLATAIKKVYSNYC